MESPALKVHVRIDPPADQLPKQQLDRLLDGEISAFERHLQNTQREAGLRPDPLSTPERGILKGYLLFASTKEKQP